MGIATLPCRLPLALDLGTITAAVGTEAVTGAGTEAVVPIGVVRRAAVLTGAEG